MDKLFLPTEDETNGKVKVVKSEDLVFDDWPQLRSLLKDKKYQFVLRNDMLMLRLELVLPSLGRRSSILVNIEVRALCSVLLFHFQEYLWSNNSSRISLTSLSVSRTSFFTYFGHVRLHGFFVLTAKVLTILSDTFPNFRIERN